MLAVENIDAYFPIPAEYMPNQDTFMLNVKGDMIMSGYNDKDFIQKRNHANNGDIVVFNR